MTKKSLKFNEIPAILTPTIKTGQEKFDKWFSTDVGQPLGTVVLVTGTSGAGKTTLMVNLMQWYSNLESSLYLREMLLGRIIHQTRGILTNEKAHLADKTVISTFDEYMVFLKEIKPQVVFVDSMQAIAKQDFKGMPKEVACDHIREALTQYAQDFNAIVFIIGHNTKDDKFAGKNEHMQMVDAHMVMEKDRKSGIRKMTWGEKNRSGDDATLYYEIKDGNIQFFTEQEYEDKLTPAVEKVPFIKALETTLNSYKKLGKNNSAFLTDISSVEKIVRNKCKENKIQFLADMVVFYNHYLLKHNIK